MYQSNRPFYSCVLSYLAMNASEAGVDLALIPEEVGHAPNCIMVEAINQSGARIFLGVNLEEIVARGVKKISLRVFSALTSLVI